MQGKIARGKGAKGAARQAALALLLALALPLPAADAQTRPRPRPEGLGQLQLAPQSSAQVPQTAPAATPAPVTIGPVSKLPLPRFASLKANEGNARRGPGLTHRIDWVFTAQGMPLRVVAEYENWRKVEDAEGFGGWVHFTLLSVARTVMVTQDLAQFHRLPDATAPVAFQAERGVLARVLECQIDWCRVNADGQRGWAPKAALWGVDAQEVIE